MRPHRQQPTRLPHPWDSPGKNTGVGCHFPLQCMKVKVKLLSRVRLLATPRPAAHQAPPALGFSRREHWSGVPLPSPHGVLGGLNKTAVEKSQPLALMNARYYPVPLPRRPGTVSSPDGTLSCPRGQLLICFSQHELFGAKACCFLPRSQ